MFQGDRVAHTLFTHSPPPFSFFAWVMMLSADRAGGLPWPPWGLTGMDRPNGRKELSLSPHVSTSQHCSRKPRPRRAPERGWGTPYPRPGRPGGCPGDLELYMSSLLEDSLLATSVRGFSVAGTLDPSGALGRGWQLLSP